MRAPLQLPLCGNTVKLFWEQNYSESIWAHAGDNSPLRGVRIQLAWASSQGTPGAQTDPQEMNNTNNLNMLKK
jgi:hypothetical protein